MSGRRSSSSPPSKPVPTDRVLADEQLTLTRASCATRNPFTARDLETLTGIPAHRCGLAMGFLREHGLIERAPGRGVYQSTKAAEVVAQAWDKSEERGHRALREVWKKSWFANCARSRLAQGAALRVGLVSKMMTLAHVGETRRRHVEVLVDLMVAVGMLLPEDGGYLRWHENPAVPKPRARPRASEGAPEADADTADSRATDASEDLISVPRPGVDAPAAAMGEDLVALLSPPVLLADLARLSYEDWVALHGHIRGLAAIIAKLRGSSMT